MIVSLHVATGAAAGTLLGRRSLALAAGPLLHLLGDLTPHRDIVSRRFEIASGAAALAALAAVRGPFDPAVLGAASSCAPDVEHVLRLPRPGGEKLFPTHRFCGWHRGGGLTASVQLVAAGVLLGLALAAPRR